MMRESGCCSSIVCTWKFCQRPRAVNIQMVVVSHKIGCITSFWIPESITTHDSLLRAVIGTLFSMSVTHNTSQSWARAVSSCSCPTSILWYKQKVMELVYCCFELTTMALLQVTFLSCATVPTNPCLNLIPILTFPANPSPKSNDQTAKLSQF